MAEPFFSLLDLGLVSNSSQLLSSWLTQMQSAYPGYVPSASNLEYVQAQIFSAFAADLAALCSEGATELFRTYATELVGVPYQQGISAQAVITITANTSPGTIATTTNALSTGGPIVAIPVVAVPEGIAAGTVIVTDPTLAHTQSYATPGCDAGATSISVTSLTPNFAYPTGSTITGTQFYTVDTLSQFTLDGLGFTNLLGITINAGTSQNLTLSAVVAGTAFNGAGQAGNIQSVQQLSWVNSLSLVVPASGGVEPEDTPHYLDRVKGELRLQAPRPITADDFGLMAVNFAPYPGTNQQQVGRATSVDGYNPANSSFNNERMVSVAVTDANGFALNDDTLYGYPGGTSANIIKTTPNPNAGWGITGWLESLREISFIVNLIQPVYSPIYATATISGQGGLDAPSIQSNIQAALLAYFNPQGWGLPPSSRAGWENVTTIYQSALTDVIQRVSGVHHIVPGTLKFGLAPNPSNTGDLALPGPIALPTSSATTIPTSGFTIV